MGTCLGCGGSVCRICEDKTTALTALSHWPLEVSVSRSALVEILQAVVIRLSDFEKMESTSRSELQNVANIIRAHLQHEPGAVRDPTIDIPVFDDWLDA